MRSSLLEYFLENARKDEMAFRHRTHLRTRCWTFKEVTDTAFQCARELESRGIGRGDRVVIWSENSPEWIIVFFGLMLRGAIAVPLDEQSTVDFAERIFEKT